MRSKIKLELRKKLSSGRFDEADIRLVQPMIARHNTKCLRLFSYLSLLTWIVMLIGTMFVEYMLSNIVLYVVSLLGSIVSVILVRYAEHNKHCLQAGIIILLSILLLFGMGAGLKPNCNATAYVALLFIMPQLFCFRPQRLIQLAILPNLIFIPLCIHYKSGLYLQDDLLNVVSFSFVAFVIGMINSRNKVHEFILETKLKDAMKREEMRSQALEKQVTIDELTGMNNFYAYKQMCNTVSDQAKEQPVGILFADLNRLKVINDTLGHESGDRYICDFARKLKEAFPDYLCYRISGDEFKVVCLEQDIDTFINAVKAFDLQIKAEDIPCAAIGYVAGITDRIDKLANEAEEHMYNDKRVFYDRYPEFSRSGLLKAI